MNRRLLACAAVIVAGCAAPREMQSAPQSVACSAGEDCEVKWSRALQWILGHSEYKLQTSTDVLLATFGPFPNDPRPAFTIAKVAIGGGHYEIEFSAGCDNIFGCLPSVASLNASFVNSVSAP